MGYSITLTNQQFYMPESGKSPAFEACRNLHGHWVHKGDTSECRTLEEVLDQWGYDAAIDPEGAIVKLHLNHEKIGDELKVFRAIAPWVKDGSYLEIVGEDGEMWSWVFDGTTCKEKTPTVNW